MSAALALKLTTPLSQVRGIRRDVAEGLAALGVAKVGQLVAHLPMRHEWLEAEAPVSSFRPGQIVSARGTITATRPVRGRRPRLEAVLMDGSGRLDLVWFHSPYLRGTITPGVRLRVQGQARRFGPGIQLANPNFRVLDDEGDEPEPSEARLRPVYPASEAIGSAQIERAVKTVLSDAVGLIEDHLPESFRRARNLPALGEAYRLYHAPASEEDVGRARRRLAYDELLLLQIGVHLRRARLREELESPALKWTAAIDKHIRARFPFALTQAQDEVVADLVKDLRSTRPTNRLIQGDVGSGKTVVALYAMLMAVATGHQAALMAPTEILAEQHFASISAMLAGSRVRVELLTGATPRAERESILARCALGEVDLLLGTHALLTETVRFGSLAVAVIDEQHRFGVHQRAALRSKASTGRLTPHVIVMTATPIPRTLAITLFGDLDISTIRALPPGRAPVRTRVVGPEKRAEVYAYIRKRLEAGEQAYIVVPTIEGAPEGEIAGVRALLRRLEESELAGLRLSALHGRLKRATREGVMERFRAGAVDAVVATTVIEVGVDVPNATIMVVEQADRFGLAQLHQLRGRVGRGAKRSLCVLIGEATTDEARKRLDVVGKTSDGFALAEKDFEIRGPGELFGVRQSGMPPFKVADLARDLDLLKMARRDAAEWVAASPRLDRPDEALLRRRLHKAHGQWLGLGDVG